MSPEFSLEELSGWYDACGWLYECELDVLLRGFDNSDSSYQKHAV